MGDRSSTGHADHGARQSRGQSSIDFVIGIAVFLVALGFVVTFIPELLSPYTAQEGPVVADRALATLTDGLLAAEPVGTLDESCTVYFLTKDDEFNNDCGFNADDPTIDLLGVSNEYQLNVTVEANVTDDAETEVVCYESGDIVSCSSGGEQLARGPTPPGETRSVVTARRVVRIDQRSVFIKLRAW